VIATREVLDFGVGGELLCDLFNINEREYTLITTPPEVGSHKIFYRVSLAY